MVIVFPAVTKLIIHDVIAGHRPELLLPAVGVALLAFFLQDLFNGLRILLNNSFEQRVTFDHRVATALARVSISRSRRSCTNLFVSAQTAA